MYSARCIFHFVLHVMIFAHLLRSSHAFCNRTAFKSDRWQLWSLLEGDFTSAFQAHTEPAFLAMRTRIQRIWKDKEDDKCTWLFVSQTIFESRKLNQTRKFYPHRVYCLRTIRKLLRAIIYTVDGRIKPKDILPKDIKKKRGCEIYFSRVAGCEFRGGSAPGTCKSDEGGFVLSHIDVNEYILSMWNQGFASNGTKLWGPNKPYLFNRIRDD